MESNLTPETDVLAARRRFSRLGIAAAAMYLITIGGQLLFGWLARTYAPHLIETDWFFWTLTQAPMYLLAFPVFCLIVLPMPKSTPEENRLDAGRWFIILMISTTVLYVGGQVGSAVMSRINQALGRDVANVASEVLQNSNLLMSLFAAVIIAPVLEELIFRKIIIDRTRVYGEKTAMLLSALIFALFHGNLYQFFYALGLGLVFGYVYLKTGRVRYTIFLHMAINLVNGVIAAWILKNIDLVKLQELSEKMSLPATEEQINEFLAEITPALPYLFALLAYVLLLMGSAIAGFALLIINRKQINFRQPEIPLPRDRAISTIFLNFGMIAMVAVCTAVFVIGLFM
ncbi:MAG TPA: CPBP family intramembrane metalloprotease [Clostridiales bacterium]|jgi:membrane protease YdiL (CAAX protease family)|nr:CPBP family intramembrane metalloprotease [Clostridiales bacterium]